MSNREPPLYKIAGDDKPEIAFGAGCVGFAAAVFLALMLLIAIAIGFTIEWFF